MIPVSASLRTSKQKIAHGFGTFAELLGGQSYRLPFGAAAFDKLAIIVEFDAKEQILIGVEIEIISAVKVDVDVFGFVGKNKYGLMAFAKDMLPPCQTFDIFDCDPAFETR